MQRGSTAATSAGAEGSGSGPPANEQAAGAPIEAVAAGVPCSTTAEVYYPSLQVKRWLDQEMERLKREGQAVGATGILLGVSEPYTVHYEPPLEYTVIYLFSKKPTRSALQRFARQLAEGAEVPVIVCPSSSSYPSSIADTGASFNVNVPLAAGSAYALKRASSEGADVEHWTTEEIPSSPSAEVGSVVHTSSLELAAKKAHAPAEAQKELIASTISFTASPAARRGIMPHADPSYAHRSKNLGPRLFSTPHSISP